MGGVDRKAGKKREGEEVSKIHFEYKKTQGKNRKVKS